MIVAGDDSSVTRLNSNVVDDAIRPDTSEPTGRLLSWRVLNSKNALAVFTEAMVTVVWPFAVLVVVPLCRVAR